VVLAAFAQRSDAHSGAGKYETSDASEETIVSLRKALAAICLSAPLMMPLAVSAQTLTFAEAYDQLAKSCGGDIEKLCVKAALGGGAI